MQSSKSHAGANDREPTGKGKFKHYESVFRFKTGDPSKIEAEDGSADVVFSADGKLVSVLILDFYEDHSARLCEFDNSDRTWWACATHAKELLDLARLSTPTSPRVRKVRGEDQAVKMKVLKV